MSGVKYHYSTLLSPTAVECEWTRLSSIKNKLQDVFINIIFTQRSMTHWKWVWDPVLALEPPVENRWFNSFIHTMEECVINWADSEILKYTFKSTNLQHQIRYPGWPYWSVLRLEEADWPPPAFRPLWGFRWLTGGDLQLAEGHTCHMSNHGDMRKQQLVSDMDHIGYVLTLFF